MPVVTDELTQVTKHVSDQGNQHNNGPQQDQTYFDNPSALLIIMGQHSGSGAGGGELMHPIGSL